MLSFVIFAMLYLVTCQRGASWQDSGNFQWRVLTGNYVDFTGLARAHPAYIAAGRLLIYIPISDLYTRLNFFSGLGMAVALANIAGIVAMLTARRWIGLLTAAMLAVTHTTWWLSTIAEVYTWNLAALTAELWLLLALLRRPSWPLLAALAFVSGLDWSIHNFALLPLPVYLVVAITLIVKRKLPAWSLAAAAGAYIVGAGLYIGMIIEMAVRTGDPLDAIRSALVGSYSQAVFSAKIDWKFIKINAVLVSLNFVGLLLPLAIVGLVRMKRRLGGQTAAAIIALTAIFVLFAVRYPVPDQFTFFLPAFAMLAVAAGVGICVLAAKSRAWRIGLISACLASLVWQPLFYAALPSMVRRFAPEIKNKRELPFRDELRYWIVPWKQDENSAERFAAAALKQASPNGIIIADVTSEHPLVLVQMRDKIAPDVEIPYSVDYDGEPPYMKDINAFQAGLHGRPVYAVSPVARYTPTPVIQAAEKFEKGEDEVLYRITWKKSAVPQAGN